MRATFRKTTLVTWHDINPRIGVSYDLFGDGKTAMKASFGRFVASQDGAGTRGLGRNNPVVRSVIETDRTWTDNGNFSVDCDLRNPLQNGECATDLESEFRAEQSECPDLCR